MCRYQGAASDSGCPCPKPSCLRHRALPRVRFGQSTTLSRLVHRTARGRAAACAQNTGMRWSFRGVTPEGKARAGGWHLLEAALSSRSGEAGAAPTPAPTAAGGQKLVDEVAEVGDLGGRGHREGHILHGVPAVTQRCYHLCATLASNPAPRPRRAPPHLRFSVRNRAVSCAMLPLPPPPPASAPDHVPRLAPPAPPRSRPFPLPGPLRRAAAGTTAPSVPRAGAPRPTGGGARHIPAAPARPPRPRRGGGPAAGRVRGAGRESGGGCGSRAEGERSPPRPGDGGAGPGPRGAG